MKNFIRLLCLIVFTVLIDSCITDSVHPLSDERTAIEDPRFLGTWMAPTDGKKNREKFDYMTISLLNGNKYRAITTDRSGHPEKDHDDGNFFVSQIGDETFLNFRDLKREDKKQARYYLIRYKFKDKNHLTMWMPDSEAFTDFIKNKSIKAKTTDHTFFKEITLQESSKSLQKIFKSAPLQKLYPTAVELIRVK